VRNASGSLFGSAYGDALGKPTEFLSYEEIVAQYGPAGPRELTGRPALVTDDTQTMLAVGEAIRAAGDLGPGELEPALRSAFLTWAVSPDNNRAPGATCLRACDALTDGAAGPAGRAPRPLRRPAHHPPPPVARRPVGARARARPGGVHRPRLGRARAVWRARSPAPRSPGRVAGRVDRADRVRRTAGPARYGVGLITRRQ
jgi:hypothetical protein